MKTIFAVFFLILASTVALLAQESLPTVTIPDGRFENFFLSLAAMIPLVTFLAAFINRLTKATAGWLKQTISWTVALALSVLAWYLKLGLFEALTIYGAIAYGFGAGLAANGFFDIKIVQAILEAFRLQKPKAA